MARVTDGFSSRKLKAVRKVGTMQDIADACPENFNLFSNCFAALYFASIPASGGGDAAVNYTIKADGGLSHIDVVKNKSDFEKRILPLQWAVDKVCENQIRQSFPA